MFDRLGQLIVTAPPGVRLPQSHCISYGLPVTYRCILSYDDAADVTSRGDNAVSAESSLLSDFPRVSHGSGRDTRVRRGHIPVVCQRKHGRRSLEVRPQSEDLRASESLDT